MSKDKSPNTILYSAADIQQRIKELGAAITADYMGQNRPLALIGMLKGSLYLMADLSRQISLPHRYDFTAIGSTGNRNDTGIIRISRPIGLDIREANVLVLEEIIRTGLTTNLMVEYLHSLHPHSLNICTLFYNPEQTLLPLPIKYVGFEVGYERLVGYGIDSKEDGRYWKDVYRLDENTHFASPGDPLF